MYLICGEALYDIFISEEKALGQLSLDAHIGGSPLNVGVGLARLGGKAGLLTGISQDMFGKRLYKRLLEERVDTKYLIRNDKRTTLSMIELNEKGSPSYQFYGVGSADCSLTEEDMPHLDASVKGLHFGSYSYVVKPTSDAFLALAKTNAHRFISFDPNVRLTVEKDKTRWRSQIHAFSQLASFIKMSEEDLNLLYPNYDLLRMVTDWHKHGVGLVMITKGDKGVDVFTPRFSFSVAAEPIEVVDTVGAGDSFQASILYDLQKINVTNRADIMALKHDDVRFMAQKAAHAAAITCSRRGADLPFNDEVY